MLKVFGAGLKNGPSSNTINSIFNLGKFRDLNGEKFAVVFDTNSYRNLIRETQRFRFYYPQYLQEQSDFSMGSRIRKFIRPTYNYAFYSEDGHYATGSFWLRAISGYLLIGSVFVGLFLLGVRLGSFNKAKRKDE